MTPNPNPSPELREAIAAAKIKARDVLGIAWHNLEEISRFEMVLANLTPPPRHDSDCGLLYDDGPEECTCEPDPLRKAAKAITCKLEESEASFARNVASLPGEPPIGDYDGVCISVGDLRALRAALSPQTLPAPGEVERLREALKPFADACNFTTADDSESLYDTLAAEKLTWRDLRNARAVLGDKA